ncbi:MAG: hypothetical protein IJU57_04355 [Clostridia bacterium]|nr:hypothetical protein [Clostridia bacterium]
MKLRNCLISVLCAVMVLLSSAAPSFAAETGTLAADEAISWSIEEGVLHISMNDPFFTLESEYSQPWRNFGASVYEAVFDTPFVSDISRFFTGMRNLRKVTLPSVVSRIGDDAFLDCPSLEEVILLSVTVPEIAQGAFRLNKPSFGDEWYDKTYLTINAESGSVGASLCGYDWRADRQPVFIDIFGRNNPFETRTLLSGGYTEDPGEPGGSVGEDTSKGLSGGLKAGPYATCTKCEVTCQYELDYEFWNVDEHCVRHWCSNCGEDQYGGTKAEPHTFRNDVCTRCGYGRGCNHPSVTRTVDGCLWYDRCDVCRQVLDSGSDHDYVTGPAYYLSRMWHRSDARCLRCGSEDHIDGEHVTEEVLSPYDESTHVTKNVCEICSGVVGDPVYEAHSFSYTKWRDYDSRSHRKSGTCFCGAVNFLYEDHYDSNGDGICDECGHVSRTFSVTVPSDFRLAVSENGRVTPESGALIVNNSNCSVNVTGISVASVNGWTLVPFSLQMAGEKVDSKLIGLYINGLTTDERGDQSLDPAQSGEGAWTIMSSSSLALDIRANVSAVSSPLTEGAVTVSFIISAAE